MSHCSAAGTALSPSCTLWNTAQDHSPWHRQSRVFITLVLLALPAKWGCFAAQRRIKHTSVNVSLGR
jgi:hypothetical protein